MTTVRQARPFPAPLFGALALLALPLLAAPAAAKETNVLIPTQDEAVDTIQVRAHRCAGSRSGETGLRFDYGRAAVVRQDYTLFDQGSDDSGRYLVRACLRRITLSAGDKRVAQGSVEISRNGQRAFVIVEGQCVLFEARRISVRLLGLPAISVDGKDQKQRLRGTLCLNAVGR